jgi:hypothetical protein
MRCDENHSRGNAVKDRADATPNRIAIIEDFECRVRRVPEQFIKEKYYYFDYIEDYLVPQGFSFEYIQDITQVEASTAVAYILGTPGIPISEQCIKVLQEKVARGCSLLVTAKEKMRPAMLSALNKLTSGWGFTFNPDTMTSKELLALLNKATGLLNGYFSELSYDSGCTISHAKLATPAVFTIDGDRGESAALGIGLPGGAKVAAFGTFWWLTFHGSAGLPALDNYKVVYGVLRWLCSP